MRIVKKEKESFEGKPIPASLAGGRRISRSSAPSPRSRSSRIVATLAGMLSRGNCRPGQMLKVGRGKLWGGLWDKAV